MNKLNFIESEIDETGNPSENKLSTVKSMKKITNEEFSEFNNATLERLLALHDQFLKEFDDIAMQIMGDYSHTHDCFFNFLNTQDDSEDLQQFLEYVESGYLLRSPRLGSGLYELEFDAQ